MQEVCSQIQAMGTMLKNIQPRPTSNTIKDLLQDTEMSLPRPMKNVSIKLMEDVITVAKPSSSKQPPPKYAPRINILFPTQMLLQHRRNLSRKQQYLARRSQRAR